jgi:ribonucleoside-triphosphate reductase (formate)
MIVTKRDGRQVDFDKSKIYNAVYKAFEQLKKPVDEAVQVAGKIANEIEASCKEGSSVEDIQDTVEKKLMASSHKDVAKAYINYRQLHKMARNQYKELMDAVGEKLSGSNIENQNANVDEHSFGGRMGEATRIVTKKFALENLVSPMAKANHENNEIYIHDLDSYAVGNHNCLSIPFDDLLAKGFNTRQTDVRPAQSINTAFQLVAVIFQLQSLQQFGGVSATHLDWTMVPYVRKSFYKHYRDGMRYLCGEPNWSLNNFIEDAIADGDLPVSANIEDIPIDYYGFYPNENDDLGDYTAVYQYALDMTTKECYQAVEGMYHNLNTLQSRSGNQLPFTSINYGTCTLPEGRMVTKALLDTSIKGIGKLHRTSIFPCGIFQCMKGVNRALGDPNYDLFKLALKSTAQRLYPNYANVDWSGNAGYDVNDPKTYFSTMGCRTANGWDINGLGQQKDGRGNICPVTIIMPTLAMEAKNNTMNNSGSKEDNVACFMALLNRKIYQAKDMLIERFNWICSQSPEAAKFMYENNVMAGYVPEEGIVSALKHGTLAIGQIGLAETLQILIGQDHTTQEGMEIAKQIEQLFKERCAEFKENYHLNFGVYYTPAENLCYTSMQKFKAKYGIIPNVSDKDFFTNSIHVPVWKHMTPFEKIDIESQLTGYSSAGCITYVELDSGAKNNLEALETIVNYAMDKDIPYFAINVPNDQCMNCGYCDEMDDDCPECGSEDIKRLRRVTGYLTNDYKTAFNAGKQQEVEMRVKHQEFNQ